ncbi:hypothetical protein J6590_061513 [Homalodisca vitripennis]|nr:hypothetical protein J6590_061513 [Homalodisca vitripennis]
MFNIDSDDTDCDPDYTPDSDTSYDSDIVRGTPPLHSQSVSFLATPRPTTTLGTTASTSTSHSPEVTPLFTNVGQNNQVGKIRITDESKWKRNVEQRKEPVARNTPLDQPFVRKHFVHDTELGRLE